MNTDLSGLKIALGQIKVVPKCPMQNARLILKEVKIANAAGCDFIVFPELSIPSYLVGDWFERISFLEQIAAANSYLEDQTRELGITVIYGTLETQWGLYGEDGNVRKHNVGKIVSRGKILLEAVKTLQPNYRFMNDEKHMYGLRELAEEESLRTNRPIEQVLKEKYKVVPVLTSKGWVRVGLILCEDMWKEFYNINPTKYLCELGVDVIFNLSASPWTWQKNRKRHEVVSDLFTGIPKSKSPKLFVYVNKGNCIDQIGKSIVAYDGASTVYNGSGEVVYEMSQFYSGVGIYCHDPKKPLPAPTLQDDSKELYQALCCAIDGMFETLPPNMRKAVIGLSGGIDSAVMAGLLVDRLGRENVFAYNMPYSAEYNSKDTCEDAQAIAKSLGISYEVIPITEMANINAQLTGVEKGTLAFENIQARCRMMILAARAQVLGAVFTCNGNKLETTLNYFTMYADGAGLAAFLADMLKREVYQIAEYLNREVFKREVIPASVFTRPPTAGLNLNQRDPFHYGSLESKGYHDEMVRAFIEFGYGPEWFLNCYRYNTLDSELKLRPGTVRELFPTAELFFADLERWWAQFCLCFKRHQGPPIFVTSRRSFGSDCVEGSFFPEITNAYLEAKHKLLAQESVN